MSKRLTTEEFISRANEKHNNKFDYSLVVYTKNSSNIKIICKIHGIYEQRPDHHLNGFGCKLCSNKKQYTTDTFLEQVKRLRNDFNNYDYSLVDYVNNNTKVKIICKKCKTVSEQTPNNHLRGAGCLLCKPKSKGEQKIKEFLQNKNIVFKEQKRFKNCKNKNPLPFDFYLPDYNMCIEFDGMQHFKPHSFNSKHKIPKETLLQNLENVKISDSIKTNFCEINNIKLVRISYKDEIESKLEELFVN